jgi:phage/plasmid-associated DNA primase
MEGYRRLEKNQGFTASESVSEKLEEYKLENSPIHAWFADSCEIVRGVSELPENKSILYENYATYCRSGGYRDVAHISEVFRYINGCLKKAGIYPRTTRLGGPGRPRAIYNVKLLDEAKF